MYNYNTQNLPNVFDQIFLRNVAVHNYPTRRSNEYHLPLLRTLLAQNTFVFTGPSFWNSLDNTITNSLSLPSFKAKLKQFLIAPYKTR